jgi:hypothetical protein
MYAQRKLLNNSKVVESKILSSITKRGYKMTKLHLYTGGGFSTPSGIKACIFGATSNVGYKIAHTLFQQGIPQVLCHRHAMDVFCPTGDDPLYTKSNPYGSFKDYMYNFDTHNTVTIF